MPPRKKAAPTAQTITGSIVDEINKAIPGLMMTGSDPSLVVTRTPSGVIPLDHVLDGGLPAGRFIEVYGPYSTLKSYFAYKAIASFQKEGKTVALVDTEHSYDPDWCTELGVDISKLVITRPETAEDAVMAIENLIRDKYDLIVLDSIAASQPKQYRDARPGEDNAPGALARVMSKGLARMNSVNSVSAVIFINQTREKIGVTFGSPMTTSGGKAMGYYASYRLYFSRIGKINEVTKSWDGEKMVDVRTTVAHKISVSMEKSKLSSPNKDAIFVYDLRTGSVDDVGYLIALGLEKGHITQAGAMWDMNSVLDKPIRGKDAFRSWLEKDQAALDALSDLVF